MLCRGSDPPLSSGCIPDGVNGYWSLRLADAQDLLMLILPKVFIFAVDHELPPVIRLIFWGGNKRVYVCLASLVYVQKRSGLFVSFELRVPWDWVLNNLCLFLHQLLELFIFFKQQEVEAWLWVALFSIIACISPHFGEGAIWGLLLVHELKPSFSSKKQRVFYEISFWRFRAKCGKWLFQGKAYAIFSKNSGMFLPNSEKKVSL